MEASLDEHPPLDADQLRATAVQIALGRSFGQAAIELGLYPESRNPGHALQVWCLRRKQAWAEAKLHAEQHARPELERKARRILAAALDGDDLGRQLEAAKAILSDCRRAEEIAVRRELAAQRIHAQIDPFSALPAERRREIEESVAAAERRLHEVEPAELVPLLPATEAGA